MTHIPAPRTIETSQQLHEWLEFLGDATLLAVDTESDSFHHYHEKVCLIQMTALGEDAIIDPLTLDDLEPLRALFADPKRIKIFHDAGYDLMCLWRDYKFDVVGLFDTMLASRLLGVRSFGLATILRERFGHEANKRLQRSDWARRPLSEEQLEYARFDTHFLPELTEQLMTQLRQAERLEWALEDFARIPAQAQHNADRTRKRDPEAWWRINSVKNLPPAVRGRAKSLFQTRDGIAARLDRPAFKVFSDSVILDLATQPPKSRNALQPRHGLRSSGVDRFGDAIMKALANAKPVTGDPPAGSGKRRRSGRFLDPVARKRYESLREVRKQCAGKLDIEPEVAIANATLEEIARHHPRTLERLLEIPQLRGWREAYFVEPIFELLQAERAGH